MAGMPSPKPAQQWAITDESPVEYRADLPPTVAAIVGTMGTDATVRRQQGENARVAYLSFIYKRRHQNDQDTVLFFPGTAVPWPQLHFPVVLCKMKLGALFYGCVTNTPLFLVTVKTV